MNSPLSTVRPRSPFRFLRTGTCTNCSALASVLALLLFLGQASEVVARSVSKGEVFEADFRSSRTYDNAVQEARLTVQFVSPSGRTNRVHGFWNGGSRWAVRFSPDELGRWTYTTECSDTRNNGLQGQRGKFLCTVQSLRNELYQYGKIQVPKGYSTFRHNDGSAFFWAADGVWAGAQQSSRKAWSEYVEARSKQGFNVALWRAAPGTDDHRRQAFKGTNSFKLNIGYLKRLDEKTAWLNEFGMVSAIAPLWEIGQNDDALLPEDQVIALLRQMVARWDAYHVAWIIAFEADPDGRRAARWRRIGRSVFDRVEHSPVILFCGSTHWALEEFSGESWVDAVAYQSGNDVSEGANLWLAKGPANQLWMHEPARPVLNLLAATEAGVSQDGTRVGTRQAVEAMARSLFVAPPAGVCYQSRATAEWDQTVDTNTVAITGEEMTEWQKSLHLPGATRVGQIRQFLSQNEGQSFHPSTSVLLTAPTDKPPARPLSALVTAQRDRALIFLPENETASIPSRALQAGVSGTFFSLKTGQQSPAEGQPAEGSTQFAAPGPGDWLLLLAPPAE